MKRKKSLLHRILVTCGFLAFLAAIAYGVYYFFFAEDEDELDGDFFDEAEEATEDAGDAAAEAAETLADAAEDAGSKVEFAVP